MPGETAIDWRPTVRIERSPELEAELIRRATGGSGELPVRVTDLLGLRPAYFRQTAPVPPTASRRRRQELGRGLHALVESLLAAPENREIRVRRAGLVGQVDLFDLEPTEIKTTETLPRPESLAADRPSYVEQLAMYCALVDRTAGRLIVVESKDGLAGDCLVVGFRFHELSPVLSEMTERAARLRAALASRSSHGLPRCPWYARGCEFADAKVCDCTGEEPAEEAVGVAAVESSSEDPAAAHRLSSQLREVSGIAAAPFVERFRDLLYPRRAYFDRRFPGEGEAPADATVGGSRRNFFRTLAEAVESGPSGEITRLAVPTGEPLESVACWDGRPYLLKVTQVARHLREDELVDGHPQYFLELGWRCAAVGLGEGRLILGYERADRWEDQIRTYRVSFDPIETLGGLAADRAQALVKALADGRPDSLPPCPAWMVASCPYRARCGCGAPPAPPGEGRNR